MLNTTYEEKPDIAVNQRCEGCLASKIVLEMKAKMSRYRMSTATNACQANGTSNLKQDEN